MSDASPTVPYWHLWADADGISHQTRCAFTEFGNLQRALEERGIEPLASEAEWVPLAETDLDEDAAADVLKLIERLEADDDVQQVFHTLA